MKLCIHQRRIRIYKLVPKEPITCLSNNDEDMRDRMHLIYEDLYWKDLSKEQRQNIIDDDSFGYKCSGYCEYNSNEP